MFNLKFNLIFSSPEPDIIYTGISDARVNSFRITFSAPKAEEGKRSIVPPKEYSVTARCAHCADSLSQSVKEPKVTQANMSL